MRKINKVRIFTNNTAKSSNVVLELKKALEDFNFETTFEDLAVLLVNILTLLIFLII